MFSTKIRILNCLHILEIVPFPPLGSTGPKDGAVERTHAQGKITPQNVWHKNKYKKINIKSGMLNCRYILKIVPFPPQFPQTTIQLEHSLKCLAQNQDRIKMLKRTDISEFVRSPPRAQRQQSNLNTPQNVWHKIRIK